MSADTLTSGEEGALTQLRAYLAQTDMPSDGRLPPERELCVSLGVSRNELRRALAVLEREGLVWRRVGKGTFLGMRPVEETTSVAAIAARTSPSEVMAARLMIEPMIAREAAFNATSAQLEEAKRCLHAARVARTWREYEACDNRFHRTIAEASGNAVLTGLFDQLNAIRRAVVWRRQRDAGGRPPKDHHSFDEHGRIFEAVLNRDPTAAETAMRTHLRSVDQRLRHVRAAAE